MLLYNVSDLPMLCVFCLCVCLCVCTVECSVILYTQNSVLLCKYSALYYITATATINFK